jgi:hypothetical protein
MGKLYKRGILFDYTYGEDESLARDWSVVGEDLHSSFRSRNNLVY